MQGIFKKIAAIGMMALGFVLGFLGYLPLGNINLTVVQLSVANTRVRLQMFILFAALMEFVYCFGCLVGLRALATQKHLLVTLNWSGAIIFFVLGALCFIPAKTHESEEKLNAAGTRRGVLVAIFNPLQIPFWIMWGSIIFERRWIRNEHAHIALFSFLCSLGTIAVLWMYAVGGKKLVEKLKIKRNTLNRFIGVLLLLLGILQVVKIIRHH